MAKFGEGCPRYLRLLEQSYFASERSQVWYFANLARKHQEECQTCKTVNETLEENLFKSKVTIE